MTRVRSRATSAIEIRDAVLAALRAHTAGCPQFENLTVITGLVR